MYIYICACVITSSLHPQHKAPSYSDFEIIKQISNGAFGYARVFPPCICHPFVVA